MSRTFVANQRHRSLVNQVLTGYGTLGRGIDASCMGRSRKELAPSNSNISPNGRPSEMVPHVDSSLFLSL